MGNNRHVVWVTALRDGLSPVPVGNLLRNTTPLELEKALARNFLKDPVAMSVNGYLINTGTKLVLVAQEAANFTGASWADSSTTCGRPAISQSRWTRCTSRTCIPITSVA